MTVRTCKSCKRHQRIRLRGQWVHICTITGKTAPMVWCEFGVLRYPELVIVLAPVPVFALPMPVSVSMPVELL